MAKANTTSTTAFENKNIEGATKSAPSGNKKSTSKAEKAKTGSKPKTVNKTEKAKVEPEPQKAEIIPADRTSVVACTKEQVKKHLKSLDDAVAGFEKTFFKIGLELYWFYTTQAYISIDGVEYANIADFAKKRYGISKATTYQYINVYDRFGKLDTKTGDCTGIDDKYKDYGSTQLLVMSQMSDEILAKCTPSQKISEMKALLKGIPDDDGADGENGNVMGGGGNSTRKPFNTIKTANTQELYSISSVEELEKIKDEIINTIRKTVGQGVNGVNYGVSVVMTW